MNAIVKAEDHQSAAPPRVVAAPSMFSDPARFEFAQRIANVFANSNLVPSHLKGKLPDCLIALHMAERLGEDPLTTMQNIMVVNGKPGFMTSYMIARANRSGVFKGPITWVTTGTGKELSVQAKAVLSGSGETVSATADMAMAEAEGWTKNPKYKSMGEHMLRFRSAAMLIRLYCPEVMLGMQTVEELDAPESTMKDVTPSRGPRIPPPPPIPDAGSGALDAGKSEDAPPVPGLPPKPPSSDEAQPSTPPKPALSESASVGGIVDEFREACNAAKTEDDLTEVMSDYAAGLQTASEADRAEMQRIYELASERVFVGSSNIAAG